MLHTVQQFEYATNHWNMDEKDTINQFKKCLDMVAEDQWACMLDNWMGRNPRDLLTWKEAQDAWIKCWVPNEYAKQTILSAWINGKYIKPTDVSVRDHAQRIRMLTIYMDVLPRIAARPLTLMEKKNLLL